jgi:D-glycero-alpha-D-manno-heptose-7-phosphate kinase
VIITKTPVRLPLGGGGSDIPSFFTKNGSGYILSTAINKYVFCLVRQNFEPGIRFTGYHKKEIVNNYHELANPIVRATLQYLEWNDDVEIVTMSDVRTNCGLGTSSAFTVGLIHALRLYRNESVDSLQLAKDAIKIEREILKEQGGIQDQYATALGGVLAMEIDRYGLVDPKKIILSSNAKENFKKYCVLYDTKTERFSSDVQAATVINLESSDAKYNALRSLMEVGRSFEKLLKESNIPAMGEIMDTHWELKKKYTEESSWARFDKIYKLAKLCGALGGKLIGAGGGGYFLFILSDSVDQIQFGRTLSQEGLIRVEYDFEDFGTSLIFKS